MINIITQEFRPQTFKEVAGQDLVKELLKAIVKKPESSPKTLILQGEYGTGKTTCARILARALNCQNRTKDGDACGHCDFCKSNIENTIFYEEFDSAMIGNVNDIKDLKDLFVQCEDNPKLYKLKTNEVKKSLETKYIKRKNQIDKYRIKMKDEAFKLISKYFYCLSN